MPLVLLAPIIPLRCESRSSKCLAENRTDAIRFVYGGNADETNYGNVSVLSIPGFRWFEGSEVGITVENAACALVGKRQMMTIGGRNKTVKWVKGQANFQDTIHILDLPTMSWKDTYDAEASDYYTPDSVRKWYDEG